MVLPVGLLMAVFVGLPVAGAFGLSLFSWDALSAPKFIGLANYTALLNDNAFRRAMTNTVVYATLYVVGIYLVSLGLALLLNSRLRNSSIFRSVYFIPVAVAPVVAALLWTLVFDERSGLLNIGLGLVGVPRILLARVDRYRDGDRRYGRCVASGRLRDGHPAGRTPGHTPRVL